MSSWSTIWAEVDRRIARATARAGAVARRVVLSNTSASVQTPLIDGEALSDEQLAEIEYFQHAGLKSIPAAGTEGIALQIGGKGGHRVVIATSDRAGSPTDLAAGEIAVYSAGGAKIVCRADGTVEITGTKVQVTGDTIELNGESPMVARVGDTVQPSAGLAAWYATAAGAMLSVMTANTVGPPSDTSSTITTGSSSVSAG